MMRRSGHRRAGFTLIELLVVISIIAVLMGLLLAGVMQVLGTGPKADTIARLTAINSAIGTFKSERSAKYIPAGSVDVNPASPTYGRVIGQFRLRNAYTMVTTPNSDSFEAQYIAQTFGSRVNLSNLGNSAFPGDNNTAPIMLDANQTLLFFLNGIQAPDGQGNTGFTGFSSNPQAPFAPAIVPPPAGGESRKGPYLELTRKRYEVDATNNFARLIDAYGTPFAYFVAYNGKPGFYDLMPPTSAAQRNGFVANTYMIGTTVQTALPYKNGGKYVSESGWQLISAGKDKVFKDPTLVDPPPVGPTAPYFLDWSNLDSNKAGDSRDNLASFTTTILGAGPK